jgi:hypothetical protein
MWVIRALFPIGAAANIITILLGAWLFSTDLEPPFTRVSVPSIAIYVVCMFITIKEAVGLALVNGIVAAVYFLLLRAFPVLDFPYSGYVFTAAILTPILIYGARSNAKEKSAVKRYFLRRQMGSLDDVVKMTGLSRQDAQRHIDEFIRSKALEVLVQNPVLYKWTEERDYPEGIERRTLDINV